MSATAVSTRTSSPATRSAAPSTTGLAAIRWTRCCNGTARTWRSSSPPALPPPGTSELGCRRLPDRAGAARLHQRLPSRHGRCSRSIGICNRLNQLLKGGRQWQTWQRAASGRIAARNAPAPAVGTRAAGASAATGGTRMLGIALCPRASNSPAGRRPAYAVRWLPSRAG